MTIAEALKQGDLRVMFDDKSRWLYWDNMAEVWIVRESKAHGPSRVILHTPSEESAVEELLRNTR